MPLRSITINLVLFCSILFSTFTYANLTWKFETNGEVTGQPIVHEGLIYVLSGQSLTVLDKKGDIQWQYKTKANTYSSVAIFNRSIYLLADNGLHALNIDGSEKWFFRNQDSPLIVTGKSRSWGEGKFVDPWSWYRSSPIIVNEKVIFGNANGTFAVSAQTGQQIWHANTGITHTKPAYHEKTIVVGSWDNHLYGLNVESGSITWKFESRTPQGAMAGWSGWDGFNLSPIIYNGTVYVGNRGSYFYAIDAENGIEKWSSQYAGTWVGSPAFESDGQIYFGTSDGFSLVGLNAKTGSQTLLQLNDFYNFAQPQANEDFVYYGTVSGELYSVNKNTSQKTLLFSTPSNLVNSKELIKEKGGLKRKYALGADYNHKNATKDVNYMKDKLDSILSLTLDGDTLYLGSANGNVYAVTL
jgi:outer membrane protein assembly factor BamB